MGNGASTPPPYKTIYVDINGKVERIVFNRECGSQDIIELLSSAMGINRFGNLQLKDKDGSYISLAGSMPANTKEEPYKVVHTVQKTPGNEESIQTVISQVSQQLAKALKVDEMSADVNKRISALEKRIEVEGVRLIEIDKCKREIQELKDLLYNNNKRAPDLNGLRVNTLQKSAEPGSKQSLTSFDSGSRDDPNRSLISLKKDIPTYPKYTLSQETIDYLKKPTFDIWHWEPNEMLSLLEHMYHEMDFVNEYNINPIVLKRWLLCVQENYRNNPFHNFRHCFCVTQMMYGIINQCELRKLMTPLDLVILITSAACHDLDHPGYNNTYQINARTELAIRYNDVSPLENHHCAVAFQILSNPECNIFANIDHDLFKKIRQGMITLILATDMARHSEILESFKSKLQNFDFKNEDHLTSLKMILIKCCDISNEVRPMEVSEPWLDCLLEEYFMQSDREKSEGLPVAPFMDREKVTKPTAQIGFIKFVLIPMFEAVTKLFPQMDQPMVQPLRDARDHYEQLKREDEEKRAATKGQEAN